MSILHETRNENRLSSAWAKLAVKPTESLLGVMCSTPGKRCFNSKKDAEKHIKSDLVKPAESYKCQCGSFHVRSKSSRRK